MRLHLKFRWCCGRARALPAANCGKGSSSNSRSVSLPPTASGSGAAPSTKARRRARGITFPRPNLLHRVCRMRPARRGSRGGLFQIPGTIFPEKITLSTPGRNLGIMPSNFLSLFFLLCRAINLCVHGSVPCRGVLVSLSPCLPRVPMSCTAKLWPRLTEFHGSHRT